MAQFYQSSTLKMKLDCTWPLNLQRGGETLSRHWVSPKPRRSSRTSDRNRPCHAPLLRTEEVRSTRFLGVQITLTWDLWRDLPLQPWPPSTEHAPQLHCHLVPSLLCLWVEIPKQACEGHGEDDYHDFTSSLSVTLPCGLRDATRLYSGGWTLECGPATSEPRVKFHYSLFQQDFE